MSSSIDNVDELPTFPNQLHSSPLRPPCHGSKKARKPPTITPKRFTRFFTPRSSAGAHQSPSKSSRSGRQLRDITRDAINGASIVGTSSSEKRALFEDVQPSSTTQYSTPKSKSYKRRRLSPPALDSSSPLSSPCYKQSNNLPPSSYTSRAFSPTEFTDEDCSSSSPSKIRAYPKPIKRTKSVSIVARTLQRGFGGRDYVGRGNRVDYCASPQNQTRDFYSISSDRYQFSNPGFPFCTKSCNTNSLVAVGDEEGSIRLIDSAKDCHQGFSQHYIKFQSHGNAVMDIAFSADDLRLVTGSGDQTARLIDMQTQQTMYTMAGHSSSVKQVSFQPGQESIIATSGRDGSIRLWDTRCRERVSPQVHLRTSFRSKTSSQGENDMSISPATLIRCISGAHTYRQPLTPSQGAENARGSSRSASLKGDSPNRLGDVSITAMAFLPVGREHLLMTASEASAVIKLWDIRLQPKSRHRPALPVSVTQEPESHIRHRPYGINSMSLSGDGDRFYALCRDSTVYAYSTNHLILGSASEYHHSPKRRPRPNVDSKEGLGPLYGFRHPKLLATTFYVKSSLRVAKDDKSEMLAVGSSDDCAVLFPTEEHKMHNSSQESDLSDASPAISSQSKYGRTASASSFSLRPPNTIPIYGNGTALIRGHQKEVTSLTWSADGDLVTVGDDYAARCWREGSKARELRQGGELNGQRWDCGWADVEAYWDDEDC